MSNRIRPVKPIFPRAAQPETPLPAAIAVDTIPSPRSVTTPPDMPPSALFGDRFAANIHAALTSSA